MDQQTEERLQRLRSIPLFADLTDDSLRRVLECATEFDAAKGHVLLQTNQPGAGLFVVEEGAVTVELPNRTIELAPGEFFGELALLDERAIHTARVVASTPVRCLAIGRDDFDQLLASEPMMAISMLRTLARRMAGSR